MRKSLEQIKFTGHAVQRMFERRIQPSHIRTIVESGEVISDYPNDVPFPRCLMLGSWNIVQSMWLLHFMTSHQYLSIVTVYADPEQWSDDFKRGGRNEMSHLQTGGDPTAAGHVPLQRQETTIIFKGVPADVCDNCGEYYLSEEITERLLQRAEEAVRNGAEVEIVRFAA